MPSDPTPTADLRRLLALDGKYDLSPGGIVHQSIRCDHDEDLADGLLLAAPLAREVLSLRVERDAARQQVGHLQAERRMTLGVAEYPTDETRPLDSLVSEALAQKDIAIGELQARLAASEIGERNWCEVAMLGGERLAKAEAEVAKLKAENERLYEKTASGVTLGNGHMAYGSFEAVHRIQNILLITSSHPQEKEDVRRWLYRDLQKAEAAVAKLREALEPFAAWANGMQTEYEETGWPMDTRLAPSRLCTVGPTFADCRQAAQALKETQL